MHGLTLTPLDKPPSAILVVDDEVFNLEIVQEILEEYGYQVDGVEDGNEALERLMDNPEKYHAVLVDRMMPKIDGLEVLRQIKNHHLLHSIPVIMQTARASQQDIQDGLNAGVLYYLSKPFEKDTLLAIVDTAVRYRHNYQMLSQNATLTMAQYTHHGEFQLCTLTEARSTSLLLANACPLPRKVVVGLTELMINAVEHGNLGIGYKDKTKLLRQGLWEAEIEKRLLLPEHRLKKVNVALYDTPSEVKFVIRDEGDGFDWTNYLEICPQRAVNTNGRGIAIARSMSFDHVEFQGRGNTVVAVVDKRKSDDK